MGKQENFSGITTENDFENYSFSDHSEPKELLNNFEDDLVNKLSFDFHRDDYKVHTDANSEVISTALQNWSKEQKVALQHFLETLDADQLHKVQYGIYVNYTYNNRVELLNICKDLVYRPELLLSVFDTALKCSLVDSLV